MIASKKFKFFMNNILIGEDYNFTAWAPGYNDDLFPGDVRDGAEPVALQAHGPLSDRELESESRSPQSPKIPRGRR